MLFGIGLIHVLYGKNINSGKNREKRIVFTFQNEGNGVAGFNGRNRAVCPHFKLRGSDMKKPDTESGQNQ